LGLVLASCTHATGDGGESWELGDPMLGENMTEPTVDEPVVDGPRIDEPVVAESLDMWVAQPELQSPVSIPEERPVGCGFESLSAERHDEYWYEPGHVAFTPNAGIAAFFVGHAQTGYLFSLRDGAKTHRHIPSGIRGLDDTWQWAIKSWHSNSALEMVEFPSERVVASFESSNEARGWGVSAMGHQGQVAAALTSGQRGGETLHIFVRGHGWRSAFEMPMEFETDAWRSALTMVFAPDDRHLILGAGTTSTLRVVHLEDRTMQEFAMPQAAPGETVGDWNRFVHSIAFSPSGDRFAVSTANGEVQFFDLSADGQTFDRASSNIRATVHMANRNNFAPKFLTSPIAWSPDGRHIAVTREEGWIALFDVATQTEVQRVAPKEVESVGHPFVAAPVELLFHPDGQLIQLDSVALSIWGCDEIALPPIVTRSLDVEGPQEITVGENSVWRITHDVPGPVHFVSLYVNDQFVYNWHGVDEVRWGAFEAGTHELRFVVDNGVDLAETIFSVTAIE
jgi:hypothetical protein